MRKSIKKIGFDMIINIFSYGLPIVTLQFVVLPVLARVFDPEKYGLMLSLTSVISIAGEMAGGNLANVRLIFDSDYKEKNISGDFKNIFEKLNLIIGVVILLLFLFGYKTGVMSGIVLTFYFILFSFRSYYTVGYRLELKYHMVFLNNVILCAGYLIGLIAAYVLNRWELVYIVAFLSAAIHLYFTTSIKNDSPAKTELYPDVLRKTILLMIAYLVGNSMNYFDRVLLYPLIGGALVSNYYVATVFGKVLNLLIAPINMVMLSYLSKKTALSKREVLMSFIVISGLGIIFTAASTVCAPIVLSILYPDYVANVLNLVPIATLATVLMACSSVYKTFSMRFVQEQRIFLTEIVYIIIYVTLGVSLLTRFGLVGFCVATVIAALVRFLLFLLGLLTIK